MAKPKRTARQEIERAFHVSFKLPEQAAELLDRYAAEVRAQDQEDHERLRTSAAAVRALHYPESSDWGGMQCYLCGGPNYPCATVAALDGVIPADIKAFDGYRYRLAWRSAFGRAMDRASVSLATEFRVPCPEPADPGRPESDPVLRPEPLIVRKCTTNWADRYPDGWLILNPNLQPGDQVWTGEAWEYRGQVFAGVIYQWTRDEAIFEAQRLAVEETARFEKWLAETRAGRNHP